MMYPEYGKIGKLPEWFWCCKACLFYPGGRVDLCLPHAQQFK